MEEESSSASDNQVTVDDEDVESENGRLELPMHVFQGTYEAKLRELLHNVTSIEIKLCSDATKQFIRLLKADGGGELLHLYVKTSSRLSELLGAWILRHGKPGMSYVLSLISVILSHPDGKYKSNDKERIGVSRALDKFARLIIVEKMGDVYKELNSKEGKRQNAALLLMASIVRRGSGLASDVAKNFDFKLPGFSKLAEYKQKGSEKKRKHSTRKSFIGFAMSFLEMGNPGLLRWILQQKEMYSGVLRGLVNDDDDSITYVLSTLQKRVLIDESLVPPGLRSVLFGSYTLEKLVSISGRENGGPAAELAHNVLVLVCTDPCNGLMPDMKRHPNPLRGNHKRLLDLMKKLKATEIGYHKDLLLAILEGRPSFGSAYMDEFPYNLEDHTSPTWFATVSLAADLVLSIGKGLSFGFLSSQSYDPPPFESGDVQSIMNCICPRPFSRSVINKGLLHSDFLVKHGTLRLLLEVLKLLDSFLEALNLVNPSSIIMIQSLASFKQEIQDKVRTLLPDPQVLLSLLSSMSVNTKSNNSRLKRKADIGNFPSNGLKKMKTNVNEEIDIVVSGIGLPKVSETDLDTPIADESDHEKKIMNLISEIWGQDLCFRHVTDVGIFFHSKLLDALMIYLRTLPTVLEGSFEFLMNFLSNPLALPTNLQYSLLSLLNVYIACSPSNGISIRYPPMMYKHLKPFISLFAFSPISGLKDRAYNLARAAMLSTGAFDTNQHEIAAWFLFIPGSSKDQSSIEVQGVEVLQSFSQIVISFLCDAITTIGNNLFKYWDIVRHHTQHLKAFKDVSPHFSPFITCVLQKCLRLLKSESGTFSLTEKSLISLYVCNTIKYLLQTQVDAGLLSALIESVLSEELEERCSVVNDTGNDFREWRPLRNLFIFSQCVLHQQPCSIFPIDRKAMPTDSSFASALDEVKKNLRDGHGGEITGITNAFISAIVCATPDGLLKNFPSVMTISQNLGIPLSLLSSVVFNEQSLLADVCNLWPEMFLPGLEMSVSTICREGREDGEEIMYTLDSEARKSAASAFSSFLRQAPFHVLFPAISVGYSHLPDPSKLQDMLLTKLSDMTSDCLFSYLRLVLFWYNQIRLNYKIKPSVKLNQLSEMCLILYKHVVAQLLASKLDREGWSNAGVPLSGENIRAVAETIFCHPAVKASLACLLSSDDEIMKLDIGDSLETFLGLSRQRVHKIDHHVLDMLKESCELLFFPCDDRHSILKLEEIGNKKLVKAFKTIIQRIFLELRDKFDLCIATGDLMPLFPSFDALNALIRFIPPLELLELAHWMFGRADVNNLNVQISQKLNVLSVGFCIAGGAFDVLSTYLTQPITKRVLCNLFWEIEEKNFNFNLVEETYVKICKFATKFELDFADKCLLKAVSVVYKQKHIQNHNPHPLSLVMSKVIMSTPLEMISHCIHRISMRKAKLLFLFTEISPLHLAVFGHLFLGSMNKDLLCTDNVRKDARGCEFSDEEYMMVLPAALSYLNSVFVKFGKQYYKHFAQIPSFYARILFSGLLHWKSFASKYFQEEYDEFFPSSTGDLLNFFNDSLLGKAILMLRYHFALSGDSIKMKKRLKLFSSIFLSSITHDELLDCDLSEMDCYSPNQSLDLINRVIAKISLGRMLLFPEYNGIQSLPQEADCSLKEISLEKGPKREDSSRIRFINVLVSTWQWMIKKFPSCSCSSSIGMNKDYLPMYKYLENFVLRCILELTTSMHDGLIKLQSIPFLEQMMKSSLLYRFEEPITLKVLQNMLTLLSEGSFPRVGFLQLLLAHSQFIPTIRSVPESSCSQTGAFFRHMPSILRSVVIPHADPSVINAKNDMEASELYAKRLEIVKLLRILVQLCGSASGENPDIDLKELHSLLLSSYGATLSDADLEIYNLMYLIESIDKSVSANLAEVDYLWGTAALKVRKEWALEQITSNMLTDTGAVEEQKRSQFRENLPIDPKICARTVLYFPYDKTASQELLSLNELQSNNLQNMCEIPDAKNVPRYDPVFILRFSIHSLSMNYIEPVEFAGLGLLAVAFVSISSPDVSMRKLGYETLGRYKNALEKCQKKKDVMRLRLLLTIMQNGIEEPWQRIPSIIALFAAESSFVLLDPLHDHFPTLSKLLLHSSRVNMKCIPLFSTFFWSSSINFRTDRLWILRLTYSGLNSDDDAQIYCRNSILEILLSFYASSHSDNESKELILQIVKKSIKLQKTARHLVEHCALLSWLSSVLSAFSGMLIGDEKREKSYFLTQLAVVIEIVNDVGLSRSINEWLQNYALEQLMELSSHLHKLLIDGAKVINNNIVLVKSVLQTMITTLKISQKRKIYQPHFTLSLEGLFQIYEAASLENITTSSSNAELGLKTILMSTPPTDIFHTDQEKLSKFLMWATSTALKSDSEQMFHPEECDLHLTVISEKALCEESLISKLQRWLIASVILGKILCKLDNMKPKILERSNFETLQSLIKSLGDGCGEHNKSKSHCEKILAATILYLQQHLGMRCKVLPSVVSALCLLLLSDDTNFGDFMLDHWTLASPSSRIRSPNEANPAWRWSFYQPWENLSFELTVLDKMDEFHACQTLLVMILNAGKKSLDLQGILPEDLENSGLYKWERSIIEMNSLENS
ncbi:Npa1 domain-containing protein [Cephalotus follicularis]|uniref:Npa1 domain-containing protein n=1 Tax=Cephalotus follicularis TaxID=3775 RepID=A0A1Q3BKW9_CEPFO|nr:Npa1 domain-containing protein [Cephalotus follicularis]